MCCASFDASFTAARESLSLCLSLSLSRRVWCDGTVWTRAETRALRERSREWCGILLSSRQDLCKDPLQKPHFGSTDHSCAGLRAAAASWGSAIPLCDASRAECVSRGDTVSALPFWDTHQLTVSSCISGRESPTPVRFQKRIRVRYDTLRRFSVDASPGRVSPERAPIAFALESPVSTRLLPTLTHHRLATTRGQRRLAPEATDESLPRRSLFFFFFFLFFSRR